MFMQFKELGYDSQEVYFNEFFSTLMDTNRTIEFFVNWKKVYENVNKLLDEISLLNGLVNIKNFVERRNHLKELLNEYPKTRTVLPLIIATRDNKLKLLILDNTGNIKYENINFEISNITTIVEFCDKTKIIELLGKVKDLYSYLLGVEVGSDTNARKNRSGTTFENLVIKKLQKEGVDVRKPIKRYQLGDRSKKPDMVLYKKGKEFALIEVNFFNKLGSKPLETIQSFINLQKGVESLKLKFILITDGPAWKTGRIEREKAFWQLKYPFNLTIAIKLIPKMVE